LERFSDNGRGCLEVIFLRSSSLMARACMSSPSIGLNAMGSSISLCVGESFPISDSFVFFFDSAVKQIIFRLSYEESFMLNN